MRLFVPINMLPPSDDDIVFLQALRQQSHTAYDRLYANFYRPLCYFAEGLIHDATAAEDMVTESLIKLLQEVPEMNSIRQLKSYLYTITRNACYDYLRANERHRHSHEEIGYLKGFDLETAERQLIRAEILQAIYAAIEGLPERNKNIVKLALLEGKNNEEIATQLRITDQTVRNRKSEGLAMLRLTLRSQYGLSPTAIIAGLLYFL
jgi:RNA polymerase sigma-70 factor (ECF subfamily)